MIKNTKLQMKAADMQAHVTNYRETNPNAIPRVKARRAETDKRVARYLQSIIAP